VSRAKAIVRVLLLCADALEEECRAAGDSRRRLNRLLAMHPTLRRHWAAARQARRIASALRADARMLDAAPALLRALKLMVSHREAPVLSPEGEVAYAAIRRATGRRFRVGHRFSEEQG